MKLKRPFLYVLLYAFLGLIAYLCIDPIVDAVYWDKIVFEDYQTIDASVLKLDEMPWTGVYIPSLDQEGLRVTFEKTNDQKLAVILSSGIYQLDFYNGNENVYAMMADFISKPYQIIDMQADASFDYDSITIQTLSGKNNRLTFLMPISDVSELDNVETVNWNAIQSEIGGDAYYALNPDRSKIQGITANLVDYTDESLSLNIRNISNMDIELVSIERTGKDSSYDFSDVILSKDVYGLDNVITVNLNGFDSSKEYEVTYRYVGLDFESTVSISMLDNTNTEILINSGMIDLNDSSYTSYFKQVGIELLPINDQTTINQAVVIPEGYVLRLSEGQTITFENDGFIRTYSPLDFNGTLEHPIIISAIGESKSGIAVVQADGTSNVDYVVFDNLSNISHSAYTTSGAVNFFESDLVMSNSTVSNNRSEDGLNVVRSHFDVSYSTFENTYSDAFDSDFSNGTLSYSHFYNTGNDGFDCSGSVVTVLDTDFIVIGDKALSIGEHTSITGSNLYIESTDLGIAIKDSSSSNFDTVQFVDAYLSFIQYNKKPVFGVSSSVLANITFSGDVGLKYLIQEHEHLMIDGVTYVPENLSKSEQIFDALINERPIR